MSSESGRILFAKAKVCHQGLEMSSERYGWGQVSWSDVINIVRSCVCDPRQHTHRECTRSFLQLIVWCPLFDYRWTHNCAYLFLDLHHSSCLFIYLSLHFSSLSLSLFFCPFALSVHLCFFILVDVMLNIICGRWRRKERERERKKITHTQSRQLGQDGHKQFLSPDDIGFEDC